MRSWSRLSAARSWPSTTTRSRKLSTSTTGTGWWLLQIREAALHSRQINDGMCPPRDGAGHLANDRHDGIRARNGACGPRNLPHEEVIRGGDEGLQARRAALCVEGLCCQWLQAGPAVVGVQGVGVGDGRQLAALAFLDIANAVLLENLAMR